MKQLYDYTVETSSRVQKFQAHEFHEYSDFIYFPKKDGGHIRLARNLVASCTATPVKPTVEELQAALKDAQAVIDGDSRKREAIREQAKQWSKSWKHASFGRAILAILDK